MIYRHLSVGPLHPVHGVVQNAEVLPLEQSLDRLEVEDCLQESHVLLCGGNLRCYVPEAEGGAVYKRSEVVREPKEREKKELSV